MIVKLISILAVLSAVTVPASATAAPLNLALHCDAAATTCEIKTVADPKTCGGALFIDNNVLCYDKNYLTDILTKVRKEKTISEGQLTMLIRHYGGVSEANLTGNALVPLVDHDLLAKDFMGKIDKAAMESISAHLAVLGNYLDMIGGDVLANTGNLQQLIEAISKPTDNPRSHTIFTNVLNKIVSAQAGPKWIRDNDTWMLAQIQARSPPIKDLFTDIVPDVWKNLLESGNACKDLQDLTLTYLLLSPPHAATLKANCLKELPNPITLACGPGGVAIRNLHVDVMKTSPLMHATCYEYLTTEQVAVLDESKPEDERCVDYPLEEKVVRANGAKLTSTCFEGALAKRDEAKPLDLGTAWHVLPTTVLNFKSKELYGRLGGDGVHHIPASHKTAIVSSTEGCERAPAGIFTYHAKGVPVSVGCFKELTGGNQIDAVIGADVEVECLKEATTSKTSDWKRGEEVGLAALNHALERPDIGKIIKSLNPEMCGTITTLEELKNARAIQMYGTKECFDNMKDLLSKLRLSDLQELEENARNMLDMNEFVKVMESSNYSNMRVEDFRMLQDKSTLCDVITADQTNSLPSTVLAIMSDKCLARILGRDEIPDRQALQHIPEEVFAKLDGQTVKKIKDGLSAKQFGVASSEVTSLEHHFAATWDADEVSKIAAYNMQFVHPTAWKAAPREAYAGFNSQNFPKVTPAGIRVMSLEKLQMVPPEVRATLTDDQAKEVDPAALAAFTDIKVTASVRKILDAALAAQKPKTQTPTAPEATAAK